MFKIQYKVLNDKLEFIEHLTEDEVHYNFMLGDAYLVSYDVTISIAWGWIPLLDLAICFAFIVNILKNKEEASQEFEFTENDHTLRFTRQKDTLTIIPSFSSLIIKTTFSDFETAVHDFNSSISEYIHSRIKDTPPAILSKFLF